ncbi:MAG: LuxR C-terminal-related transcriptional regulator [Nocardiopsaceae bacterium]|jgi:DNA-binding CsgD family transcriptional regulator|nr:LuxR C-terminal-related transcriptional regulator [Nocardiopsaceae bacterium]
MAGTWARNRATERIAELAEAGLADREFRRAVLDVLHEVVGFGSYVWLLTDPVSEVGSAPLADVPCLPELPGLVKSKYATAVNRWTNLRRQGVPARLLTTATGGDLAASPVWRDVLSRYGIADVASAVFADQHGCWGFLDLWRDDAAGPFDAADAAFLADVAAPLARGLRRMQARTFIHPATAGRSDAGSVVLTLDDDLRIIGRTAASRAWLDVLLPPQPNEQAIPASVYNVAAQLLAAEAGIDDHPAFARIHLAEGFWLTLRAARLSSDAEQDARAAAVPTVAVTIEETSAADRLDLFGRAFGLTARERQLLSLLATGSDTRKLARQMSVSEHTVTDHLKSIFAKTGARDRVTVLSRALGTR